MMIHSITPRTCLRIFDDVTGGDGAEAAENGIQVLLSRHGVQLADEKHIGWRRSVSLRQVADHLQDHSPEGCNKMLGRYSSPWVRRECGNVRRRGGTGSYFCCWKCRREDACSAIWLYGVVASVTQCEGLTSGDASWHIWLQCLHRDEGLGLRSKP